MSFQPSFQPRGFDFLKDVDVRLSGTRDEFRTFSVVR